MYWAMMTTRETFKPAAVEPAQPPEIMSINKIPLEKVGQRSKSAETKPVVAMDAAWKDE